MQPIDETCTNTMQLDYNTLVCQHFSFQVEAHLHFGYELVSAASAIFAWSTLRPTARSEAREAVLDVTRERRSVSGMFGLNDGSTYVGSTQCAHIVDPTSSPAHSLPGVRLP